MILTNNFVIDPLFNFIPFLLNFILSTKLFYKLSLTIKKISRKFDLLFKIDNLIYNRSDCIALSIAFSFFENKKLIDLLNVAESNIAKTKKKTSKIQKLKKYNNSKKKTVKFIKQNFSKFKYVKREIQIKRVKKNLNKTIVSKITQNCKKRNREKNKKKATTAILKLSTSIVIRFDNNAAKSIILFNNTKSN